MLMEDLLLLSRKKDLDLIPLPFLKNIEKEMKDYHKLFFPDSTLLRNKGKTVLWSR